MAKIEGFQVSSQQRRIWSLQQADNSLAYRAQCAFLIEGAIQTELLKAATHDVVSRHEILRTSFRYLPGRTILVQIVGDQFQLPINIIDLSNKDESAQEAELDALFEERKRQSFDFEQGPLVYVDLARMSREKHTLLFTASSLCADGRTMENLAHELGVSIASYSDAEARLDEPIQYCDFAQWQYEILESEGAEVDRQHWRESDLPDLLKLNSPFKKTAARDAVFAPEAFHFVIEAELAGAIRSLLNAHASQMSAFLLAAWAVLHWRLIGRSDICIAMECDGRRYAELERALGPFASHLPLPCRLEANITFFDALRRIHRSAEDLSRRQEFFSWERAGLSASGGTTEPFCPISFEFATRPETYSVAGLTISAIRRYDCMDRFELMLRCVEREDELRAELHYDSNLFQEEDVSHLSDLFRCLLQSCVANPGARIEELNILTPAERQKLLVGFNDTGTPYALDRPIHQLIEAEARRRPDGVAVIFENRLLTYDVLNSRGDQLARYLRGLGVGPDAPVGVCMEPSLETLVAILGVLKAGGAYVPLDPSYPRDRLIFMLKDTRSPVLLTQRRHLDIFQLPDSGVSWSCTKPVCLDAEWERIVEAPEAIPPPQIVDKNLAYVIYTSGSTGKPKGVQVTHRNLRNSTSARLNHYSDPISCFLLLSSFAFDSSVAGIFGTLCQGGTVLLVADGVRSDAPELIMLIERHRVSHTLCLPSLYSVILEQAGLRQLRSLRAVTVAGEACTKELVDNHQQRFASTALFNEYGPTEATVWTTVCECRSEGPEARPPIGRPIANARVHLLSPLLRLAPVGIEGELYVGGENVARGYLDRPDLTAERFIADPFSGELGARLYKTGDLARYRSDGNIEFFGRRDHQVKIRGYRIELGEIEAALKDHQHLREAVVLSWEARRGEERLVAYVVPIHAPGPAIDELRRFLREKLPDYMVPSAFVELEYLPLAPNGKVDRGALPAPDRAKMGPGREFVAPRTPIEEVVAGSWAEVLGVEQVGATDNFFDLGGHSINTTQVISRLSDAFQMDLPVRSLFESPTVAGLAGLVEAAWRSKRGAVAPPIERGPREQSHPLSFGQERLWFLHQLESDNTAYNAPYLARLKGPVNLPALEQSLSEVIRRHETLRTIFLEEDGRALQAVAQPVRSPLPIVDLEHIPAGKWESLARSLLVQDAKRLFDLEQGPLLRLVIARLTNEEHILLLTMSHIISDGWSMGVLVRELAAIYDSFSTAAPSPIPELPFQYADYSRWQREWLRGEKLEAELSYWKRQLGGGLPVLQLPADRTRPRTQTFRGATHSFSLPAGLSKNLRSLSRQEGATLFMTLMAAFQTLLHRYSGQDDIPVGTPIANRNQAKVEGLIGFFVNTLVLRADLSGDPTYLEVLARVREITLDAYANQDLPFEQLVDALRPERDLARSPLFQVMFILQNAPLPRLEISKLAIDLLEVHNESAKFDLTLSMTDSDEKLLGVFEFNTDLFDRTRVARMAGHFQALLEDIAANPNLPISSLRMLSEAERHHVVIAWNETQEECAAGQVHQLIEAQAGRTPDAVAAEFEYEQVSYAELNARANQLAYYLRSLGAGPEVTVGVFVERSIEMIVGVLAILKAGGAYVPIDPGYPQERIRYALEDARAMVLLSHAGLQDRLLDYQGRVVYLDEDWEKIGRYGRTNPDNRARAEDLAYVIYTSGSTGYPKGVQIEHRAVANFLSSMRLRLAMSPADVLLAVTTLSFDIAGLELFLPLMVGARVVALSHEAAADGVELLTRLQAATATVMQATPATWQMLLEAGWDGGAHLKVLCGGDALSRELATQLRMRSACLWNLYGPTETTIWSTAAEVEGADAVVSIGRPIGNTCVYLLDSKMNPTPIGAPGNLYIGGEGLARGYFNRPDLTAEKFLPSPFSETPGDRLYNTADLVSYRVDGLIEFLGRADYQVKVRGFRIELGEIEELLRRHIGVREAVVVARDEKSGARQLVAYIAPEREPAPRDDELRDFLRARLPEYMVPARFMLLESLPLTLNGKVDRRALPALSGPGSESETSFVAPRTEVESRLSAIWAQTLGLERVGVHDNFFKLGGDSILGVQIIAKARQAGYVLVAKDIFRHQNIAELAAAVDANRGLNSDLRSVANRAPLTPMRHWSFEQDLDAGDYTPSDFPEAGLSQEELNNLLAKFGQSLK